jgi:hypothetical protein
MKTPPTVHELYAGMTPEARDAWMLLGQKFMRRWPAPARLRLVGGPVPAEHLLRDVDGVVDDCAPLGVCHPVGR